MNSVFFLSSKRSMKHFLSVLLFSGMISLLGAEQLPVQLHCPETECLRVADDPNAEQVILESIELGRAYLLLDHGEGRLAQDKGYEAILAIVRAVGQNGGRVVIEPLYVATRTPGILFAKDIFSVSYNIVSRVQFVFKYGRTQNYHAKVVYHPADGRVLYTYFMHRNAGDPCQVLISNCQVVPYLDDSSFDAALHQELRTGRERIQVTFPAQEAVLPEGTIRPSTLKSMGGSVRLYKWLVATKEAEKRPLVQGRFLGTAALVSLIDISFMAYDAIKATLMYRTARPYRATIYYQDKKIQSVLLEK